MSSLEQIVSQIEQEIRVDESGKGFATISGAARLCGVSQQVLSKGYNTPDSKLSQTLITHGFDPYNFSEIGVPDIAVGLTVSYYANKAGKRCTDQARLVNDVLLAVGVRSWMQQVKNWQPPQPIKTESIALPPADVRLANLTSSLQYLGIDASNPRVASGLKDLALNILGVNQFALPASSNRWRGLVEVAQEMGYQQASDLSVRSALGLHISKLALEQGLERKREYRLCNGTDRKIWIYLCILRQAKM